VSGLDVFEGPGLLTGGELAADLGATVVVPRDEVVTRATGLAEHFGTRSKGSVAAIKKAVYFGGSKALSEGLHVERTEFLMPDQSKDGQELMLDYLANTDATGEFPLYDPDTYARALESGSVPGHRSTNGR
jgi:enoyl-CoA hydratase